MSVTVSDSLELELQTVASWDLGVELRFSVRAASAPNCGWICLAHIHLVF